jgi:limonene-1,2-epoxide hydrolase
MAGANGNPTDAGAVVRGFLQALERQDAEAAKAMVADDIVYENKGLPAVRGRARFDRTVDGLVRVFDGFEAVIHNQAVAGDVVLNERTDVLRKGDFEASFWVCGRFEVRDGVVVHWRDYFDFADVTVACLKGLVGLGAERLAAR